MKDERAYERSHPWLAFSLDLRPAGPWLWALLGQAFAYCDRISRAFLPSAAAAEMSALYRAKGVRATAAIEGNALSEEQVRARAEGKLKLPPSQEYLGREVDNILAACREIEERILSGRPPRLSPDFLADCNRRVLSGLEARLEEGVVPGGISARAGAVGRYRGAPREDCAFLLQRLCRWLEEQETVAAFADERENRIATAVFHAVLAHLYIAWIHPFGDGNGRTARLVEFALLARAGVPPPSAQLLSCHYNVTRAEYRRQLDRSSRANSGRGDALGFVRYALQGFVDGLREQCDYIEDLQLRVAWEHLVYELFGREKLSPALHRRRELALALRPAEAPVSKREIPHLNPGLGRLYAGKTTKTLTRDLNWLEDEGLVERRDGGHRAKTEIMRIFRNKSD